MFALPLASGVVRAAQGVRRFAREVEKFAEEATGSAPQGECACVREGGVIEKWVGTRGNLAIGRVESRDVTEAGPPFQLIHL